MIDKENSLTFQNISNTMKMNKARKQAGCSQHPERTPKYRNIDTNQLCCVSCAIQEASRGAVIEVITKNHPYHYVQSSPSGFTLLQEIYQQSQEQIQDYIQQYNHKYQRLLDALTDMQIRDLIIFNRKIEENHSIYKKLKEGVHCSWDKQSLVNFFSPSHSFPIFNHINQLIEDVNQLETRNQQKGSRIISRVASPIPRSKHSSPLILNKNRSQELSQEEIALKLSNKSYQGQKKRSREVRQSFTKSQTNTGSFQSKNSKAQELKKSSLEDTPESVKMFVSHNGLKLPEGAAVAMFEKIDICESVDLLAEQSTKSGDKGSMCSLKKRNRYEGQDQ